MTAVTSANKCVQSLPVSGTGKTRPDAGRMSTLQQRPPGKCTEKRHFYPYHGHAIHRAHSICAQTNDHVNMFHKRQIVVSESNICILRTDISSDWRQMYKYRSSFSDWREGTLGVTFRENSRNATSHCRYVPWKFSQYVNRLDCYVPWKFMQRNEPLRIHSVKIFMVCTVHRLRHFVLWKLTPCTYSNSLMHSVTDGGSG